MAFTFATFRNKIKGFVWNNVIVLALDNRLLIVEQWLYNFLQDFLLQYDFTYFDVDLLQLFFPGFSPNYKDRMVS